MERWRRDGSSLLKSEPRARYKFSIFPPLAGIRLLIELLLFLHIGSFTNRATDRSIMENNSSKEVKKKKKKLGRINAAGNPIVDTKREGESDRGRPSGYNLNYLVRGLFTNAEGARARFQGHRHLSIPPHAGCLPTCPATFSVSPQLILCPHAAEPTGRARLVMHFSTRGELKPSS